MKELPECQAGPAAGVGLPEVRVTGDEAADAASPMQLPHPLVTQKVEAGHLGCRRGRELGWGQWSGRQRCWATPPPQEAGPAATSEPPTRAQTFLFVWPVDEVLKVWHI